MIKTLRRLQFAAYACTAWQQRVASMHTRMMQPSKGERGWASFGFVGRARPLLLCGIACSLLHAPALPPTPPPSLGRYGDEEAVEDFIAIGKNVNEQDAQGRTPMHYAGEEDTYWSRGRGRAPGARQAPRLPACVGAANSRRAYMPPSGACSRALPCMHGMQALPVWMTDVLVPGRACSGV